MKGFLIVISVFCLVIVIAAVMFVNSEPDYHQFNSLERIDNVERVLMHQKGTFTLFTSGPSNELVEYQVSSLDVKFITDVALDKKMWLLQKPLVSKPRGENVRMYLEFHIHDAADINPAGWREKRGKQVVTGDSVVIQ